MASAGLGLAQGAMQGFNFMDQLDKRERRMGLQEAQNQRAEQQMTWRKDEVNYQQGERERQEQLRRTQALLHAVQNGQTPDPELIDSWSSGAGVEPTRYLDAKFGESLDKTEAPLKGQGSIRDQTFLDGFNDIFGPEINRNNGETSPEGWSVRKKRAAGIFPVAGGGIAIDLEVEEEDANGQTRRRNAPLTTNRSINDSGVKVVPATAAIDQLTGHRLLYNAAQKSPAFRHVLEQRLVRLGGQVPQAEKRYGEPFQHETLGMVQPGPDGRLHQLESQEGVTITKTLERPDGLYNIMSDGTARKVEGIEAKPRDLTSDQEKALAAGYDPQSPEGIEYIRALQGKSGNNITINNTPKLPSGYQWTDPNKPELGMQPIKGGPADSQNVADASKTAMIAGAMESAEKFGHMVMPEGDIDRGLISEMQLNVPFSKGRTARVLIKDAIEAKLRAESGAAVPDTEVSRAAERFMPSMLDNDATIRQKMTLLKDFLQGAMTNIRPDWGGKGREASQSPATEQAIQTVAPVAQQSDGSYAGQVSRSGPQPGQTMDGYTFKGGDPADPNSWEPQ